MSQDTAHFQCGGKLHYYDSGYQTTCNCGLMTRTVQGADAPAVPSIPADLLARFNDWLRRFHCTEETGALLREVRAALAASVIRPAAPQPEIEALRERVERVEKERDEYRTLARIGVWHADCRPNREMAARELQKSQAIIDKLADEISALRAAAAPPPPLISLEDLKALIAKWRALADAQRGADPLAGLPVDYFFDLLDELESALIPPSTTVAPPPLKELIAKWRELRKAAADVGFAYAGKNRGYEASGVCEGLDRCIEDLESALASLVPEVKK